MAVVTRLTVVLLFLAAGSCSIFGMPSDLLEILRDLEILVSERSDQILIAKFREVLARRGTVDVSSLYRKFRIMDDDGSQSLSLSEFSKGMSDFSSGLNSDETRELFNVIDKNSDNKVDFDEFVEAGKPPMNEHRLSIVKQAFQKADKNGDGVLTTADLDRVVNVNHYVKYQNGEWSKERVLQEFLKTYDSPTDPDNKVTFEEFVNYYNGVSVNIDNDAYFDLMIRNAWKI